MAQYVAYIWVKREVGKSITHFSLTQLFNPLLTLVLFQALASVFLNPIAYPWEMEESVRIPFALRVWQSGKRESRGLYFVYKKRRWTWGRNIVWTGNKRWCIEKPFRNPAILPFPSIHPMKIILALIPPLPLPLCSVTHKYVTHALKGNNSHFLSYFTWIRRRNCLKSNGYEMDF